MEKFKENLKKIRMGNMFSQAKLAEKSGIEPSHISHYECGRRIPSVPNLIKLSKALNCTMEDLTNED
jgi:transcriptional regulator with XRE-family HTH domain